MLVDTNIIDGHGAIEAVLGTPGRVPIALCGIELVDSVRRLVAPGFASDPVGEVSGRSCYRYIHDLFFL